MQHGAALAAEGGQPSLTEAVASGDWGELPDRMQALCRYAVKLTLQPWDMEQGDVAALRAAGLSDRDIVDANQVSSYYNYVNRVADGLGVELEERWPATDKETRRYSLRVRFLSQDLESGGSD